MKRIAATVIAAILSFNSAPLAHAQLSSQELAELGIERQGCLNLSPSPNSNTVKVINEWCEFPLYVKITNAQTGQSVITYIPYHKSVNVVPVPSGHRLITQSCLTENYRNKNCNWR
ncbi:MAG: hypothetical protein DI585_04640 [Pseudomonas fluorescens]|nr:MAG: hypothetical protein DI585_04640 [Pseudomonas fluorescens]